MTELEKIFYCDRLYAYAMRSLEKNKRTYENMKERGIDTKYIEIEIEAAEYALGMKEDRPKMHRFVDNRRKENLK